MHKSRSDAGLAEVICDHGVLGIPSLCEQENPSSAGTECVLGEKSRTGAQLYINSMYYQQFESGIDIGGLLLLPRGEPLGLQVLPAHWRPRLPIFRPFIIELIESYSCGRQARAAGRDNSHVLDKLYHIIAVFLLYPHAHI